MSSIALVVVLLLALLGGACRALVLLLLALLVRCRRRRRRRRLDVNADEDLAAEAAVKGTRRGVEEGWDPSEVGRSVPVLGRHRPAVGDIDADQVAREDR